MTSFQKQPSGGDLVPKFPQVYFIRADGSKPSDADVSQVSVDRNGVDEEEIFHEAESNFLDERNELTKRMLDLEEFVTDLFVIISALKVAYVELQAAHAPYDPEKLHAADKAVILEFKKLSEKKHLFREYQRLTFSGVTLTRNQKPSQNGEHDHTEKKVHELQSTILQKEKMLEACKVQIEIFRKEVEDKNVEIEDLQNSLVKLSTERDKIETHFQRLSRSDKSSDGLVSNVCFIPRLFLLVVEEARETTSSFAALLMAFMKASKWDLDAATNSIEPGIVYANPDHRKFAFESYVCHRMFSGFENENFYINGSLSSIVDPEKHRHECLLQFEDIRPMDPLELVSITPDCLFGRFCHRKYLQVVHEKMEEYFFGHLRHREEILKGGHPRTKFYQSFLRLAKAVWLVHRLAFSFNPAVNIFQVRRNFKFHPLYMESVVQKVKVREGQRNYCPVVGLTINPGFCVGKAILKCQVYLDDMVGEE